MRMSARLSRRSRRALVVPALAAALALAPVAAPTALAVPGGPAAVPVDMPFDGQGADDAPGGTDRAEDEQARKAEDLGGAVVTEVIDLVTGVVKCGLNLATESVPCPL